MFIDSFGLCTKYRVCSQWEVTLLRKQNLLNCYTPLKGYGGRAFISFNLRVVRDSDWAQSCKWHFRRINVKRSCQLDGQIFD
jgi:hypothetical protein